MSKTLFEKECLEEVKAQGRDKEFAAASADWLRCAGVYKYPYHFSWLGRPIIQLPQDMLALQEIIWAIRPDLIFETGIAHGGSLIFSATMLELNAAGGGPQEARVLGLDIDIRAHNRAAIEAHPMYKRISMIEGSSIDPETIAAVKKFAEPYKNIMVCLDSNHTHDHVLAELKAYAPMVAPGGYCVVSDTLIEYLPDEFFLDRPWGRGNNPMTAVEAFLKERPEFAIDEMMDAKLMISCALHGYLKRRA